MAPKKRPATTPKKELPIVLNDEAMADLRYLEPTRTRNRVISCLNELFVRVQTLEHMHQEPAKPKPRRR